MPQASAYVDDQFSLLFGKEAGMEEALLYLESKGFHEDRGLYRISEVDWQLLEHKTKIAINYLCEEWDFAVE